MTRGAALRPASGVCADVCSDAVCSAVWFSPPWDSITTSVRSGRRKAGIETCLDLRRCFRCSTGWERRNPLRPTDW